MKRDRKSRSLSPTFVCVFHDDVVTRMTVYTLEKKLDVARGVRLSRHAYQQRTGKAPPEMAKAHFEKDGTTLASYSASDLVKEITNSNLPNRKQES